MIRETIKMPKLGLSMTTGIVAEWLVKPGESFRRGQAILGIETEKIVNELEAPADGQLVRIDQAEGAEVAVGEPLGEWLLDADATTTETVDESRRVVVAPAMEAKPVKPEPATPARPQADRIKSSPSARYLARELGVDIHQVPVTAVSGRIKKADVQQYFEQLQTAAPLAEDGNLASSNHNSTGSSRRRPATGMEKSIARRLVQSKQEAPHFYLMTEVAMDALSDFRRTLNNSTLAPKISFTHLFMAALVKVIRQQPTINSVWQDDHLISFDRIDLGLAVDTENGLYAPVVRNLQDCSMQQLVERIDETIARARSNRLTAADQGNAAFTLSNGGMHDITYMVPIINPGQSAIFGTGSVRRKFEPDAEGKPVLIQQMGLAASFDHRVFSGLQGIAILNALKQQLENPLTLLM